MNTLIKRLPLLAFVLAAVFAFAFTKPVDPLQPQYGQDDMGLIYDVTNVQRGSGPNEYQCDITSETCLWADIQLTQPLSSNGKFVPGANLVPIN
ncbi:hypothetical protein CLV48_11043 [Cecembia rubra]|uniref:Uncharacterized protein n=2 Tax=Cecembia rubra TaxID=1485585 RepID=A0A2P8DYF9_9BACT|nr:hypothetical protein CLV48_11043 [Cecembia rubra]